MNDAAALTTSSSAVPSQSPARSSGTGSGTSASTLIFVACIALLGVLLTAGIQWWVGRRTSNALLNSALAAKDNAEAVRTSSEAAAKSAQAAQDAVGVNADSAIGIARRAESDALAKRYHDAAEQLGHASAPVRLAGVYAMARLADDWTEQRQTCVDVLCAYIRTPWPSQVGEADSEDRNDRMVRKSLLAVISDHLRGDDSRPDWTDVYFDFSDATFWDSRLYNVAFGSTPNFSGATFKGKNSFESCIFLNGATFDRSHIEGTLSFHDVEVAGNMLATTLGFSPNLTFDDAFIAESGTLTIIPRVITEHAKVVGFGTDIAGSLQINRHPMLIPSGNFLFEGIRLNSTAKLSIDGWLGAYSGSDSPRYQLPGISFISWTVINGAEVWLKRARVEAPRPNWHVPVSE